MYLYRPYKQFSTTKVLPLQMVPISGLAQGLIAWLGRSDLTGDVVMVAGVVVLFAIPAVTFSTKNCWELSGDG